MSAISFVSRTARSWPNWLDVIADPVRLQILRVLSDAREATVSELIAFAPTSGQTVRRHLEDLVSVGVIVERRGESDGETPGRPPTRYSLRPDLRESVCSVFRVAC